MIQPPTSGPTVRASTARHAGERCRDRLLARGKSRNTAENTDGMSTPPAKPCTTRQVTSAAKAVLAAQPSDAALNSEIAATKRPRIESTRVSRPVSGMAITSAIR